MIYEQMLKEQKAIEQKLLSIQTQLQTLPQGKLICSRNQNRYKWYISNGHTKIYLPKKERKLAEQLAVKKYLTTLQTDLLSQKKAIDSYLRHFQSYPPLTEQLLKENSEYQRLLTPYFKPLSQELSDWTASPFEQNTKHPELLIHKTLSGHLVRSKSEAMIATSLYIHHIPFRYECALPLGKSTIYPDFTIRHPQTGHLYYWEHFGKMDDPSYYKKVYPKLLLYNSHGIVPSHQLITTYETLETPLSINAIEKIIYDFFL